MTKESGRLGERPVVLFNPKYPGELPLQNSETGLPVTAITRVVLSKLKLQKEKACALTIRVVPRILYKIKNI